MRCPAAAPEVKNTSAETAAEIRRNLPCPVPDDEYAALRRAVREPRESLPPPPRRTETRILINYTEKKII